MPRNFAHRLPSLVGVDIIFLTTDAASILDGVTSFKPGHCGALFTHSNSEVFLGVEQATNRR